MTNEESNDLGSPHRGTGGLPLGGQGAVIYNVTVKVEPAIADAWLHWLHTEHAPEVVATACFTEYRVAKLLEVDDSEGPTYAVQYHAPTLDQYREYIALHASRLRKKAFDKWGDRFIAFRTVMKVV